MSEAQEKPAPSMKPVAVKELGGGNLTLTPYNPKAVAEFGNKFMFALVAAAGAEEEAQKLTAAANEAKQFLSFEITRAIFDLAHKHREGKDALNVHAIFGEKKDVERLNTRLLMHMGVMRREVNDADEVVYKWTDPDIEAIYAYTKELKESDEAEYNKRFNNRKRLNMRLSEGCKAAAALMDQKLDPSDLYYSENEVGDLVPTIRNAPKEIAGKQGTVQLGSRKVIDGAKVSPTMSSLTKIAADRHKEPKGDRADKGEKRDETKMGMSDEEFGKIINNVRKAIQVQEGEFSEDAKKQITALHEYLGTVVTSFK